MKPDNKTTLTTDASSFQLGNSTAELLLWPHVFQFFQQTKNEDAKKIIAVR